MSYKAPLRLRFVLQKLPDNQTDWQKFLRETAGTWQDMPMAEEIRAGWDYLTPCEEL